MPVLSPAVAPRGGVLIFGWGQADEKGPGQGPEPFANWQRYELLVRSIAANVAKLPKLLRRPPPT